MSTLHALVLAAGAGSRFGGRKLLAPWRGAPLIYAALDAAATAPVRGVIVVTGFDAGEVSAAVRGWMQDRSAPMPVLVQASDYRQGLSASLRAGIRALPDEAEGAFVFLGDMPCIPPDVPNRLRLALAGRHAAAVPVFRGRRGHPVLLTRGLFEEVEALSGDFGAGKLLDRLGNRLARVEVEEDGVLFDVDEKRDLEAQPGPGTR
ncbi:nucleotidyltransferase family protein [Microvirga pudoricolor]|uniref:nucleotidyltransferase family protein n=1 Tax=Microvirga pudoricolor TaxID=2778729 RepID=UPI0019521D48|nr:nucleotidyltransferase family protein [Microvirga pudoricolor]MBM6593287.1 nucleotidyltransferase family protein [Microvirga pudoricolor]